jgi:hypothetical protein
VSTAAASYLVWGLFGVAAAALWWVSHARPDAVARPARVVERLATGPVLRVVFVAGFLWTGWHLFAR